jgi:hypothetical protein
VSLVNQLNPQPVSGSVAVTNLDYQKVTLASATTQIGASVSNFPATQSIQGLVGASVSNLPGTQPVSIASYSVTQPVSLASTSVTQPVSGTVTASTIGYVGASVTNFPATQQVQGLVGASVTNLPGTQPISIASYSVTQPVSVASTSITQPVSLASSSVQVGISNFPATQQVQGLVGASVSNLPAVQPVSGSVSVVNFPATQQVMGLVGASIANQPTVTLASSSIQVGVSVANFPVNIGSVTSFPAAAAAGGASPYHYVSGASVNQNNVKATAGTVYTLAAMNQNTSQRYLKLYDKASTPSPGTDIPRQTYMIPGASAGAGAVIPLPVGLLFASGIGFAITAQISDLDATAIGASDVVVNMAFI